MPPGRSLVPGSSAFEMIPAFGTRNTPQNHASFRHLTAVTRKNFSLFGFGNEWIAPLAEEGFKKSAENGLTIGNRVE